MNVYNVYVGNQANRVDSSKSSLSKSILFGYFWVFQVINNPKLTKFSNLNNNYVYELY
jgi:hypothetical protein